MKISVVGTGRIGSALARAWRITGHDVRLATRDTSRAAVQALAHSIDADLVELPEAADADVIALAVPYASVDETLFVLGALEGRIVIDCTNAVGPGMQPEFDSTTSAAEELQRQIPQAHVFKSFNAQGVEIIVNPGFDDIRASNFYCGNDAAARAVVDRLVRDAGFDPVYVGRLDRARLLESLMLLWVSIAKTRGTRSIAFKLLEREPSDS